MTAVELTDMKADSQDIDRGRQRIATSLELTYEG
jgi:hypothetical protein